MKVQDLKTLSKEKSISVFTLRKFVKKGLPHFRIGRKILVDPEEFDAWFKQCCKVSAHDESKTLDQILEDTLSELNMILG
jgi:hypothetical protein